MRSSLLLAVAAAAACLFMGWLCHMLWGFFWHAVIWAAVTIAVFCVFVVVAFWIEDHVTAWRKRAAERASEL